MRRLRLAAAAIVLPAGLILLVVVLFALAVLALGRVPRGGERTLLWWGMAAAAVAAVLFVAMRGRLARIAKRLRYGQRAAPMDLVEHVRTRFSRAVPLEELLLEVVEVLREGLALSAAEIWTRGTGALERAVSDPERARTSIDLEDAAEQVVARAQVSGSAWAGTWLPGLATGRGVATLLVAPVTHAGELHGLIVAERPPDGERFGPDEERVLAELARQLGLALHNLQLDSALQASLEELRRQSEELRASRARVVAAADAERRRIERDLHDGAQQRLVALAVKLRLVREAADPEVRPRLDALAADVEATLEEVRDLAHGIYPALLLDAGLREAIPAAAMRAALPTRVEVSVDGRHPPEIEAAVYFCCLEALQNAAKHAGSGTRARVRVWTEGRALAFEVADDGAGFDPRARPSGSGLIGMRDRVGAVGGAVAVESARGGGTCIHGSVPLPALPDQT